MAKTESSKAVAVAEKKSVVAADDAFLNFEGAGLENVKSSDLLIPRLTILQALSPQINSKKPEYIEGAKIGDICDVGTGELFDPPLVFLPVYYIKQYLEWAPRATGKGLIAIHNDPSILDECKKQEKGPPINSAGNLIIETAQFFGLNLTAGGRQCFIPMASTQLKKARRWLTLASSEKLSRPDGSTFTPPIFYRTYNLSTVDESNPEGDWSGWKIERGVTLQDYDPSWKTIYENVLQFRDSLMKGQVRGDLDREEAGHTTEDSAM